jgi:predicted alpha-1,6-mannanase (GH76 family)
MKEKSLEKKKKSKRIGKKILIVDKKFKQKSFIIMKEKNGNDNGLFKVRSYK